MISVSSMQSEKSILQLLVKSGQLFLQPSGLAVVTLIMLNPWGIHRTIIRSCMRIPVR